MPRPAPDIISHWHNLYEGLPESPQRIYSLLEEAIKKRQLPGIDIFRITLHEKGILSAKREYLRVLCKKHAFDICAAPYGTGFFISWWLGELPGGCIAALLNIPILGILISYFSPRETYYTYDTALMFQDSVHTAVLEVFDQITSEKGIRLTELERKPIMGSVMKK
jgi:hypothetical protein